MIYPTKAEFTRMLVGLDPLSHDRLLELIYDELRRSAGRMMARERVAHTLQPTALVHEAWLRLVDQDQIQWTDRAHFLGIAARCMRQVLVDHARTRGAAKRGGDRRQVTLVDDLLAGDNRDLELLSLDQALARLGELDARAAQVAERRIFGGMTIEEIAHDLDVSRRTVDGDWAMARLWLTRELEGADLDAPRFAEIKRILLETLAQPAAQRDAFLDEACGGDRELRREVADLLTHETAPAAMVEQGVGAPEALRALADAHRAAPERPPERIGPYRIVGVLGEGGMGVVYHGRQEEPLRRDVALKMLRRGLDTERILERFAWERRSLARMDHPHIARILDAGVDERDRPYVALELVDGAPITAWCDEHDVDLDRRLDLMIRVCLAVQHAHDRGVLHRDLKPSNVMVRQVDGAAVPCIIDFGVAKALDMTDSGLTVVGQQIGTPAYMSPEQRAGEHHRVDVRSDVFALGVILYELLAGRRPFGDDGASAATGDAAPPSRARRETLAAAHAPTTTVGLTTGLAPRRLRGDLDRICLKAIRPEPERRYASAAALAEDLRRFREGRPVAASPDSWRYRLRKAAQRHPATTALVVAAHVFAVAGLGFLLYHTDRLHHERRRALEAEAVARREAQAASEISSFLEGMFTEIDPLQGEGSEVTARELLAAGAARLEDDLADQPLVRGRLLRIMADAYHAMAMHEESLALVQRSLDAYAQAADSNATLAERAQALSTRGTALHDLGRYADAEVADRAALALTTRLHDGPDPATVAALNALSVSVQAQGRLDEATDLLQRAVDMGRELGADGEAEMAYAQNMLGYLAYQRGRFRQARDLFAAALAVQQRLTPGDDYDLANSLNNMGGILMELGDLDGAERNWQDALDMFRRIYRQDHPTVARGLQNLARAVLQRGDVARASALSEAGWEMNRKLLGDDNPYTSLSLGAVARVREAQGRVAEAESLWVQVLAQRERQLGPDNRRTRNARLELGRLYLRHGRTADAERVLAALYADELDRLDDEHPQLNQLRTDLAEAYLADDRRDDAVALLRQALPHLEEMLGAEHESVRHARELLAAAG